jgi:hypothetical protein
MKNLLILKSHHEICGNEVGLITHQSEFLDIVVNEEAIFDLATMKDTFTKYKESNVTFDFIYLCTHGDGEGFDIDMGGTSTSMTWAKFGQIVCESGVLNKNTIFLLACCRGGLFKVATDMLAVCNKINFVCGATWKLRASDITTGFIVFLYSLVLKKAEPTYAAQKASLATDYTFVCYDRSEIEYHSQFHQRQINLFYELGWIDINGRPITTDEGVLENTGLNKA